MFTQKSGVGDDPRATAGSTVSPGPRTPKALLPSIALTAAALFATYLAVSSILLPTQVAQVDEENKVTNLAIVISASFVAALITQPIVGALSDRTRSRLGRRAPWMLIGAAVAMIFLLGMGGLRNLLWITVFWVVVQVALNALQSPLSAVVPDRFPRSRRGIASAMMGIGTMIGTAFGTVIASQFVNDIGLGYAAFGIGILVVTVLFVAFNRDTSSVEVDIEPFQWKRFLAGFWVSPKKSPDFAWAFAARFFLIMGYFVVATFNLYILTDYLGMPLQEAAASAGLLALAGLIPTMIAIMLSGWWSDRIGRRKVFIYAASVFMVAGLSMPLLFPSLTGMIAMSVLNGFGFGLYMACDAALMTEVLPADGVAAGKDLGILNLATSIPQAASPAVAGIIIGSFGGYSPLFVFGMIAVVVAALLIVPIKGVR
ncbi:MFS transporter [Agromyces sp. NPDC056379]|uniref:MFS transporter n=1 Tax=unclassified Agromyces TaxID=2639701 RepID=UPI0035D799EF